jgi:hypothetical protein
MNGIYFCGKSKHRYIVFTLNMIDIHFCGRIECVTKWKMNYCSVLYIERNVFDDIDKELTIQQLHNIKPRKRQL